MKVCSVCDTCFEDSKGFCFDAEHGELRDGPHSVDIVPGYIIERVVATSPKAAIFQARQIEYGQNCVIMIAEGNAAQFLADASTAASLFHAGVAGVVESGELSNGSCFAVFESFGGKSLRDGLREGTLSLLDQIRIARHAAEAIRSIHAAGLVHGTLRPENVSIAALGTEELSVKVHNIDLGSAFANGLLSNRFSMDSSIDSLRYFAPERFRGEAASVHSDVYSLGILLYELLSRHTPFDATSATELAAMHLNQKPPEIKIENFDLRMLLTHTINESLQKQPSFRQSTADLFARQMRHIEQLATHVSTPPPAVAIAMAASSAERMAVQQPVPRRLEPIILACAPAISAGVTTPEPVTMSGELALAAPMPESDAPVIEPEQAPTIHPVKVDAPLPFVQAPKRSRLKGMKKRVRSYASDTTPVLNPTPTLIEWQQPNNDVDSMADANQEAKAAADPSPTLIEWQQPEDDVPSIEAVREELASSGDIVAFEPKEEVFEVQLPSKRIEVKWNEPIASEFAPVLTAVPGSDSDESAVFGYQLHGRDLGKLPIYGVAALAFLIVGFGVFRLGTELADDSGGYIGESRPTKIEVPAPHIRSTAIEPQMAVVNIPAQPIIVPAPDGTSFEEPSVARVKAVETSPSPTSKTSKRSASDEPRPAAVAVKPRVRDKDPFVPSTLVITRGTGKPKSLVIPDKSPSKVGSGATRPRIVSLPD